MKIEKIYKDEPVSDTDLSKDVVKIEMTMKDFVSLKVLMNQIQDSYETDKKEIRMRNNKILNEINKSEKIAKIKWVK